MSVRRLETRPEESLVDLPALAGKEDKHLDAIEPAPRKHNERDIEIINANAEVLNKEAADTLEYQADWWVERFR